MSEQARTPSRIQRKRTKGWRMPEGAVYVGRPTRWGNPFYVDWRPRSEQRRSVNARWPHIRMDLALRLYERMARGGWDPVLVKDVGDIAVRHLYDAYVSWMGRIGRHPSDAIRDELRGLDLACWCPPGEPCHADVLLEIANR